MTKRAKPKKRIGRPTKKPRPGERVPLGLRITPDMKRKLERAALKSGRSLSQEVERRIERSLDVDNHLVIAHGARWSPLLFSASRGQIWVGLGEDPSDYGDEEYRETTVILETNPEDLKRLRNYFAGAPWPYDASNADISAAGDQWISQQIDIRRGK